MAEGKGSSSFSHILQTLTTLVLVGILVVLAMLLVEFKNMTDREKGIVIRVAKDHAMDISMPNIGGYLGTSNAPFYMVPLDRN
ncbi:Fc.00g107560.m01.CDS01 [Cosmosporella sp. VM-42]